MNIVGSLLSRSGHLGRKVHLLSCTAVAWPHGSSVPVEAEHFPQGPEDSFAGLFVSTVINLY
jgi:hypothetical protein